MGGKRRGGGLKGKANGGGWRARGEERERWARGAEREREKVKTIKDEGDDNQRAERRRLDDDGEGGGAGSQSSIVSFQSVSQASLGLSRAVLTLRFGSQSRGREGFAREVQQSNHLRSY